MDQENHPPVESRVSHLKLIINKLQNMIKIAVFVVIAFVLLLSLVRTLLSPINNNSTEELLQRMFNLIQHVDQQIGPQILPLSFSWNQTQG
jgi:hypothetical protein